MVTSGEKEIGKDHLSNLQDIERPTPAILTTSQLLTTGVDAPTCKNVVLALEVNSMTEFKQIIGRGTGVREDAGKLWFSILDYTGSATRLFASPAFDGEPVSEDVTGMDDDGNDVAVDGDGDTASEPDGEDVGGGSDITPPGPTPPLPPSYRRKFDFDGGAVEIAGHYVIELDAEGPQLRIVEFTDYTRDQVRTLFTSADELRPLVRPGAAQVDRPHRCGRSRPALRSAP